MLTNKTDCKDKVGFFDYMKYFFYHCGMEKQKHGFEYQNKMCEEHSLVSDPKYTGMWDAYKPDGTPCVIKTFKHGSELPLSDLFSNTKRNTDFYLIYGVWKGKKSNIIKEGEVLIDISKWKELLEWEHYDEMKHWIKYIVSNSYSYDSIWKVEKDNWKDRWGRDRIVQPRFKRDHGIQRRIQSAVAHKNIDLFLEYAQKK